MGCCASRPRDDEDSSSSNAGQANAEQQSSAAQRTVTQDNPEVLQASTSSLLDNGRTGGSRLRPSAASRLSRLPQDVKPTKGKALKGPPEPAQIEAPLVSLPDGEPTPASSVALLRKARVEFFETRVTGSPEMWNVIRMACGLVEDGKLEDARVILEASGGSCPTGVLWGKKGGCFDERGERYVVPAWCVGRPPGIIEGSESVGTSTQVTEKVDWESREAEGSAAGSYTTEAKGKGKMMSDAISIKGAEMRVKVRYSHTARDEVFTIGDQSMLEALAQMAKQKSAIPHETKVRFVYLGRLLDHKRSLSDISWQKDQILSLFVFD